MGLGDFFKGAGSGLISGAASLLGGGISSITGKQSGDREYERQKEFAQNGIRWKVEDAKAAGIHPIFAIGANTATYSPQAAVGTDYGISAAGQNIARAIEAKQTAFEREENNRISRSVGEAQANYYNSAARRQDAEADLIGQRSVREALEDIRFDTIGQLVASSSRAIRTQQLPPSMPRTDKNDDFVEEVTFTRNPKGQLYSLRNTQDFHDMNEDVPVAEMVPWLNGITWDARAKLTREPIMVKGKWYAFNDKEGYVPININTYKPWWNKWFTSTRSHQLMKGHNSLSKGGGIRAFYGG